jgi:hypothetical protein
MLRNAISENEDCDIEKWANDKQVKHIYKIYSFYRIVMAVVVNIILIINTVIFVKILRRYFGHTFDYKVK